jgi:alginate O-acetyltransferase complex protein AlgI
MLFNSYEFIFVFMPAAVAGFALLCSKHHKAALLWLTAVSLSFYAYWDWHAIWILAASIVFNFACGEAIERSTGGVSKRWLVIGVVCNLFALGIFKYASPRKSSVVSRARTWIGPRSPCHLAFHSLHLRRSRTLSTCTGG